jgi:hypothetical protein
VIQHLLESFSPDGGDVMKLIHVLFDPPKWLPQVDWPSILPVEIVWCNISDILRIDDSQLDFRLFV